MATEAQNPLGIMDRAQWSWALFDAGMWGYGSVTISTIAPIIFVDRMRHIRHVGRLSWSWKEALPDMLTMSLDGNATDTGESEAAEHVTVEGGSADALMHGLDLRHASSAWIFMVAASTLAAGILCPILGALADRYSARKVITYVSSAMSVLFMSMFAFQSRHSNWQEILLVVGSAMMFTSITHCFYNSLLMLISDPNQDMIKVSCLQCCIGSFGSALLMVTLGMTELHHADLSHEYVVYCFVFAAVWFVLLAIPMWIWLEEDHTSRPGSIQEAFEASWQDLLKSLQNTEFMKFFLCLMLFNDANATLHSVYLVYGAQIGIPTHFLLLGAVFNRIIAGFSALAWLGISAFADSRACFMMCILVTMVSIIVCAWMTNVTDFYIVVVTMTVSSSGAYIFSKVLLGSMTPKEKASHNFGFMGMINRIAGFLGPFVFSTLSVLYGTRIGFLGLATMALAGLGVLAIVDFEEGFKVAAQGGEKKDSDEKAA